MFRFETGDGPISLQINPFGERPNLDVLATLYDEFGTVIATDNPPTGLSASFDMTLTEGNYYVGIEGVGSANYSDYGSIGFYTIDGQLTPPNFVEPVGESGTVSINHFWSTIQLERVYKRSGHCFRCCLTKWWLASDDPCCERNFDFISSSA